MANFSQLTIGNTTYDVKDTVGRDRASLYKYYGFSGAYSYTIGTTYMGLVSYATIRGFSKKENNEIVSLGDDGSLKLKLYTSASNNCSVTVTTGLPLRSTTTGTFVQDYVDFSTGVVVKKCYYDETDNEVKALAEPEYIKLSYNEAIDGRNLWTWYPQTTVSLTKGDDTDLPNIGQNNAGWANLSIPWFNNTDVGLSSVHNSLQTQINENIVQVSTMPTASANLLGKIFQFTGTTGGGYTNGYFYKCEEDTTPGTYKWAAVSVQSGGGGGSSVQSDWNQTDSSADDYIKNKPDLSLKENKIKYYTYTIPTSGWSSSTNRVTVNIYNSGQGDMIPYNNRNVVGIVNDVAGIINTWANYGVALYTTSSITVDGVAYINTIRFSCVTIPPSNLTFSITSMEVN